MYVCICFLYRQYICIVQNYVHVHLCSRTGGRCTRCVHGSGDGPGAPYAVVTSCSAHHSEASAQLCCMFQTMTAPRLQRFVTVTARLGLVPVSVSVRHVVDKLARLRVSFRVLLPVAIIIILPLPHTHLYLNVAPTRRTSGLSLAN